MLKRPKLITGVPRSGTTLACKLLNSVSDVVALHEPILPTNIRNQSHAIAVEDISHSISKLANSLLEGKAIEHGDKERLVLDNPISEESYSEKGIRKLSAKRGLLKIPKICSDTQLFIKQNAMFTALVPTLNQKFEVIAIIRNPVDVLTSWMTVDLPVNRGRIPGGERFNAELASYLESQVPIIDKQVHIYHWFVKQYKAAGVKVLKYEDIVTTGGEALFQALELEASTMQHLTPRHTNKPELADALLYVCETLNYSLISDFYSHVDIKCAFLSAVSKPSR